MAIHRKKAGKMKKHKSLKWPIFCLLLIAGVLSYSVYLKQQYHSNRGSYQEVEPNFVPLGDCTANGTCPTPERRIDINTNCINGVCTTQSDTSDSGIDGMDGTDPMEEDPMADQGMPSSDELGSGGESNGSNCFRKKKVKKKKKKLKKLKKKLKKAKKNGKKKKVKKLKKKIKKIKKKIKKAKKKNNNTC